MISCSRQEPEKASHLRATALTLQPIQFMFAFLFYTDAAAVFWALATIGIALPQDQEELQLDWQSSIASAAIGAVAIAHRQTNVVWVAFAVLYGLWRRFPHPLCSRWRRRATQVFVWLLPHVCLACMFLGFIVHNGGVVVGDSAHHRVAFHGAQLCYSSFMTAVLFFPVLIPSIRRLFFSGKSGRSQRSLVVVASLTIVAAALVWFGTHAHAFLLADNRHIPYLLWRRVLGTSVWVRLALCPLYALSAILLHDTLRHSSGSNVPTILWGCCSAAVLVPTPLWELRYATIPVIVFGLLLGPTKGSTWEFLSMVWRAIGIGMMLIFLLWTRTDASGETSRLMW